MLHPGNIHPSSGLVVDRAPLSCLQNHHHHYHPELTNQTIPFTYSWHRQQTNAQSGRSSSSSIFIVNCKKGMIPSHLEFEAVLLAKNCMKFISRELKEWNQKPTFPSPHHQPRCLGMSFNCDQEMSLQRRNYPTGPTNVDQDQL
jgi:hypothetical protein